MVGWHGDMVSEMFAAAAQEFVYAENHNNHIQILQGNPAKISLKVLQRQTKTRA